MSSEDENESYGPKKGIKLNKDQANTVIRKYFPLLTVTRISHINRGYNNRVYIATTSESHELILRLCGRFWTRYKTENEVATLLYAFYNHNKSIPVPRVLGYCSDAHLSGVDAEYILMEKAAGVPLENVWSGLSEENKKKIIQQIAKIYSKIQGIRFSQLGSFQLSSNLIEDTFVGDPKVKEIGDSRDSIIRVGKFVEIDGGPFNTYLEYFRTCCEAEVEYLRTCAFMKESVGYDNRVARIEKFVAAFGQLETVPSGIEKEFIQNVPFVLTHGDIETRNIMVNKETMSISCLLDWEFAGSYPIDEEWFTGFSFVHADTTDCSVFDEMEGLEKRIVSATDSSLRTYFLDEMRKNGVVVPDDIPGHMTRAELYYFKGFICPWWLREKRDPIPESHYTERANACSKVDLILEKYGF